MIVLLCISAACLRAAAVAAVVQAVWWLLPAITHQAALPCYKYARSSSGQMHGSNARQPMCAVEWVVTESRRTMAMRMEAASCCPHLHEAAASQSSG